MPVYEFRCPSCRVTNSILVRSVSSDEAPACARCAGPMRRVISRFAFHRSLQSKVEQLDPKYDKMIDAANPDLASENIIRSWGLDKPIPEEQKRVIREKLERFEE